MVGLIIVISAILLGIGILLLQPVPISSIAARQNPALDYSEALRRISGLQERENAFLLPEARIQCLTHGNKTAHAIVLVHGFTNCAKQFSELGKRLHALGFNVLIATQPHHGLLDRMTEDQSRLKAEELAAYADEMANLGAGLGERVIFAGLSGGAIISAWVWLNYPKVDRCVLMAPAFGLRSIPPPLTGPAVNLFSILPNMYLWFDPIRKTLGTPEHTYPRFSTRALIQILRLGFAIRRRAETELPESRELIVITNPNDGAVNNALTKGIINSWQRRGARIKTHEFDLSMKLVHDFIDPAVPGQPVERTYPLLIDWIIK